MSNEAKLIEVLEQMVDIATTLTVPLIGFRCRYCWQLSKTPHITHLSTCLVVKATAVLKEVRGY